MILIKQYKVSIVIMQKIPLKVCPESVQIVHKKFLLDNLLKVYEQFLNNFLTIHQLFKLVIISFCH